MIVTSRYAKKFNVVVEEKTCLKERIRCTAKSIWVILLMLIIFGGIMGGLFTATEDVYKRQVGGSMGPIYGTFFRKCAFAVKDVSKINANSFSQMLESALEGVKDIGGAKIGDKTLIDTMEPATVAFKREWDISKEFRKALKVATVAAETGKESTKMCIRDRYKIHIHRSYVGNYFTSLDMMGVTLTILKLDKEMVELIDFETNAVSFKQL